MAGKKKSTPMRTRRTPKVTRADSPTASKARKPRAAVTRVELGCPGHFICAKDCNFRRHTQVGNYRVSTVGDLFFDGKKGRQTLGASADSFFETNVFETTGVLVDGNEGCGCVEVKGWGEIDGERYATAGAAQAGHERYVQKYLALSEATHG